jgi:hypothetical protein
MFPSRSKRARLIAATIPGRSRPIAVTANSDTGRKKSHAAPSAPDQPLPAPFGTGLTYLPLSRQRIIERERRWALPAALSAFLAVILFFASIPIEQSAVEGTGTAEQLRALDENSGTLILANVVRSLGLLALIPPLYYLFEAAKARSAAVRGALVGFVFLGPVLFAAQNVASGIATTNIAADYTGRESELSVGGPSPDMFLQEVERQPDAFEQVVLYPEEDALDAERTDGEIFSLNYPPDQEESIRDALEANEVDTEEDADGLPGDLAAENLIDNSDARQTIAGLLFPALLAMIVAVVYPSLHAMRVGLLTRFFGTLGMAIGVSVLFIGLFGLFLWVLALGLLILDRWPGDRPPAWDAGEAVPWPRPGEEPPPKETEEGEADEEAVKLGAQEENPHAGRRERAKRRKRKRRS